MPLIILGLLLLIGLLAYSIVRYINSDEEDPRSVRERYPKAFQPKRSEQTDNDDDEPIHAEGYVDSDSLRGDIDYMIRNFKENITEAAKEHGIDLDKWGRDPYSHNPYSSNKNKESDDDSTIIFPTDNVEEEKNKRNIH